MRLPITAAYHASHLPIPDLEDIFRCAEVPDLPIRENVTLVSTSSGSVHDAPSLHDVLDYVHEDIFQNPISWNRSLRTLKDCLQEETVIVSAVGPTNLARAVCRALIQNGIDVIEAQSPTKDKEYSVHNKLDDVAIVGMAGRFSGGQDLDKFWENICEGRDTHTKVDWLIPRGLYFGSRCQADQVSDSLRPFQC